MDETSSQELHCHLMDYRLVRPDEDDWDSFKTPIRTWVDCWYHQRPEFETRNLRGLRVCRVNVGDETIIRLSYDPEKEPRWPLSIEVLQDGEFVGDRYNYWHESLKRPDTR